MRRAGIVFLLTLLIGVGLAPVAQARPETNARYIVVLKPWANPRSVAAVHKRLGVRPSMYFLHALRGYAATIPSSKLALLRADPRVASIRSDRVVHIAAQTNPTGVKRIGALKVGTGNGVNVAVIDTGIDTTHPDLATNIAGGYNCTSSNHAAYQDGNGHGTHVAGIIAALNNSSGVRGVAPGARLWSIRVLDNFGTGFESWITCGIDWATANSVSHGGTIKIANLSLEASDQYAQDVNCSSSAMHQSVCALNDAGVTVIVAAGNHAEDIKVVVPASYDEVLTVSALSDSDGFPCGLGPPITNEAESNVADDTFAPFSSYATLSPDKAHMIAAPGVDIYSTVPGGTYGLNSGTSMAAPHVSGAAARFLAAHPSATPSDVKAALLSGGEPRNVVGSCTPGHVLHSDPSNMHAEPVVLAPSVLTNWSRFPSGLDAATGNPYTHGR